MIALRKKDSSSPRRRLTLKERIARAEVLVDDARIDGKRFRGKAPILKLVESRKRGR